MLKNKKDVFKRLAAEKRLSHACLFYGPPTSPKEEFAVSLANFLETGKFELPTKPLIDMNLVTIAKDETTIGIDKIRNIKTFLSSHPLRSPKKTVIIKPAESLSWQAQPSLLKIVEEPPSNALLIFIAHDAGVLIPALTSRLTKFFFCGGKIIAQKNKSGTLASLIETAIINLYLDNPIKNSARISFLLEKEKAANQFNLNEKIQKKAVEIMIG